MGGERRVVVPDDVVRSRRPRAHTRESPAELDIFAATERLLTSVPQHELSVAMILREAGIARGTFYFYFASKHEVITGLLNRVTESLIGVMRPWSTRQPGDPEQPLRESLTGAATVWKDHRAVMRACQEGWHANAELAHVWVGVLQRFTEDLAISIVRERALGLAPPGRDAREIAATLTWSAEHLFYLAGRGVLPSTASEVDIVESLVDVFVKTIYAAPPSSS